MIGRYVLAVEWCWNLDPWVLGMAPMDGRWKLVQTNDRLVEVNTVNVTQMRQCHRVICNSD